MKIIKHLLFAEKDDNFPGYVKLSLAEVKANDINWVHVARMIDDKLYLSNSLIMDSVYKHISVEKFKNVIPLQEDRLLLLYIPSFDKRMKTDLLIQSTIQFFPGLL